MQPLEDRAPRTTTPRGAPSCQEASCPEAGPHSLFRRRTEAHVYLWGGALAPQLQGALIGLSPAQPSPAQVLVSRRAQTDTLTGDGLEFSAPKPRIPRSPILGAVYRQRPYRAHRPRPDSASISSHFLEMLFKLPLKLEPAPIEATVMPGPTLRARSAGS